MESQQTEMKEIADRIKGKKESYGAFFELECWNVTAPNKAVLGLTEHKLASMLLFASGSLEDALKVLAYVSQKAKESC